MPVGTRNASDSAGIYVGAYPITMGRPDEAEGFYGALSASPAVGGLEIPWTDALSVDELLGLRALIPERWRLIITMIPGTMAKLGADPSYGLASNDADAAQRAVDDVTAVRAIVDDFHKATGSQIVRCIEVHSAPRHLSGSSSTSLARSLAALTTRDGGGDLVLEHVDAPVDGRPPAKGFLPFADELEVIADAGMGVVVNWGRSVIEARDASGAESHITLARQAGLLRGVVFSGVSDVDTPYGPAWSDEHLPFVDWAPGSLLTFDAAAQAIALAGDVYLGVKMNWAGLPKTTAAAADMVVNAAERIASMARPDD